MYPQVSILGYPLSLYNIFNFLAVMMVMVLGLRWNYRYGKRYPIGIGILLLVAPFAFVLGRVFFYLFMSCPGSKVHFFDLQRGGSMFLGAFLGGVFGILIYLELKKVPRIEGLEVFIPYIPVGGVLGRMGCFCQGCCHGTVTQSIFGLRFPKESAAWWAHVSKGLISSDQFFSLPVHPTQLYEIGIWIVIGVILLYIRNRQPRKGVITCSFLGLYFLNRLVQDFVRADYGKGLWGLDMMQWLVIGIIPLSGLVILFLYREKWMGRHSLSTAACHPEQGEGK